MPYGVTRSYGLGKKKQREYLCVFMSVRLFRVSVKTCFYCRSTLCHGNGFVYM